MERFRLFHSRIAALCLVSTLGALMAACGGGGGNSGGGGGGSKPTTPTVTVTPANSSITTADSLSVTVTVRGTSSTPTGSVTLTSGTYTSAAATLNGGSATITIPAGKLAPGTATVTGSFTPDSASSSSYNSASGTATVTVTLPVPTVTVTPASSSITTAQSLLVTVVVAGPSGSATPTGTVTLTSGSYSSAATTLTSGSASITIAAGALAVGADILKASYTPDAGSSSTYGSASGTATVTVTQATPTATVTVTPGSLSLATSSSLPVTVKVTGSGATPTGSVVLSSGTYTSASTTLTSGSASITIPAYSLVFGSATLSAAYTPDAGSTGAYSGNTGTATVSVARATPQVTVTPASLNIDTSQSLDVTVVVTGQGMGAPAASGTVKLTSGAYGSSDTTLANGSATITIAAGALAAGSYTLTATYSADTAGSSWFNSNTGLSAAVTVLTLSTVTVNESTTIAPVSDQLLGINLESWYNNVANATSIDAAFGKAGIKAIRWPGGSWSDIWHWRTSATNLLPYNCNDPGPGTGWGGYSSFADFVTSIVKGGQFDLALTANYGSNATCDGGGDPTEAAGWVAEAVSEGVVPSHVTVGNENYGSWEFDLHPNKHDPPTYAASVIGNNGFYKLIKDASPNTLVGVVVDANCTTASGCTNGWDSTVLSTAKGSYDFVEYHYYPQYSDVTSDTYLVQQAALDFTKNINTVKTELTAAGNTTSIPIYVGEVGGNSANPGTQSWSITQGLYAGQLLGEAMNNGVSRLTWWDGIGNCFGPGNNSPLLYGWQNWGAQSVFSDGPTETKCPGAGPIGTLSPTARAFQLFSHLAVSGASALSTTVNGDKTNIRAYAAAQADGSNVLFLFNLNQNQSQPVMITLSKTSAANDVTVITYDKAIYDQTHSATPVWADPTTTDMGARSLPLTLTLTPWSMNVVIIK